MRSPFLLAVAALLAVGCSDSPTATVLAPSDALLGEWAGEPPPPWAIAHGTAEAYNQVFTWTGHFLSTPTDKLAWLQFKGATGATFSRGARIMSRNGIVSGFGTVTLADGQVVDLKTVTTFTYETWRTSGVVSFSGENISGRSFGKGGGEVVCCDIITHVP